MPLVFDNGKVWNKREKDVPADAVYIGRPSQFGNPYSHMNGTIASYKVSTREIAVDCYTNHAGIRVMQDSAFREAVKALHGKDLVCWCAPQDCHGRILLQIAAVLNEQDGLARQL